ncbi:MAG: MFS transporter [Croceibacterium sp.]
MVHGQALFIDEHQSGAPLGSARVDCGGVSATFALWFVPQSLDMLYLNRFLSGAFAAAIFPTSQAIVAELTVDLQKRARMFSWLSIAPNVGYLVGPAIGGWFGGMLNGATALRVNRTRCRHGSDGS